VSADTAAGGADDTGNSAAKSRATDLTVSVSMMCASSRNADSIKREQRVLIRRGTPPDSW